mmetsp:Transcript_17196/g.24656  ORF Transcript_17196/g.24656 Transcript_17196/m.24656 type:complete len:124 (-) Transcript_17196:273-644(-)
MNSQHSQTPANELLFCFVSSVLVIGIALTCLFNLVCDVEWVVLVTVDLAGKSLKDESLLTAFKKIDTDMDGYIFENELKEFANLTNAEAKALFEQMDLNMDGRVNFVEFLFQFFHDSDFVVEK